jgi:hypothetical protein
MPHEPQTGIPSNHEIDWPRACHCAIQRTLSLKVRRDQRNRTYVKINPKEIAPQFAQFRASATKQMRPALFWVVTQQGVVIPYLRLGAIYPSHLHGSITGTFIRDPTFRSSPGESNFCRHSLYLQHPVRSTFVAPVIVDVFQMYKKVWWCVHGTSLVVCTWYQFASSTPRWQLGSTLVTIIHILLLQRGQSSDNTAPSYHLHDSIAGNVSSCTYVEVKNITNFHWATLSWRSTHT